MSLNLDYEKADFFYTFYVTQEMYEAISRLPWIEVSKPRADIGMDDQSLKVKGKNFKVAYRGKNGICQVREAFRFLAEGLAGLELISKAGGLLVNERCDGDTGRREASDDD